MTLSCTDIQSKWSWQDWIGALAVRLAFRRMHYSIEAGLYKLNSPNPDSPVFVSANYKLSFDHLRKALDGIAAWILVLDTKGINVWCAAGKGTFGTEELLNRLEAVRLSEKITHKQLIVPQLGAPGVAAHHIQQHSGFHAIYGPVRAKDIPRFLDAGSKASPDMRRVQFNLVDRLAIVPVEMIGSIRKVFLVALTFALIASRRQGYGSWSWQYLYGEEALFAALLVFAGYLLVSIMTPALLPWLPGRAFSVKGMGAGILAWLLLLASRLYLQVEDLLAWLLLFIIIGSFMGLNLTGASTYTSLSGVKKETRLAVPWMIAGLLTAAGLWFWSCSRM
ncbi:mercury methylation corrinoid protein HgcA [Planctomycetota bacterium]